MKPNEEILQNWKLLYEFGDIELIHQQTIKDEEGNVVDSSGKGLKKISRNAISTALKPPYQTSETTYEAIKKFYNQKAIDKNKKDAEEIATTVFVKKLI